LLTSEVWALGLGEIKLDSALNEPLRAEIELLSATADELDGLRVALASADTFDRYGLDRPTYLQDMEFQIVRSGGATGNVVEIRSATAVTEPFLTFLIEASWSRGRLLREYTVLLDPPTFAPRAVTQSAPTVTAPTRSDPADSGRIERPAPVVSAPRQAPPPSYEQAPREATPPPEIEDSQYEIEDSPYQIDDSPYESMAGGDVNVYGGDTLWGISSRERPDSRLTMNQTMLAIFEANPDAFGGNINVLREGASLRIPSADEIFQITRGEALDEVLRQHAAWDPVYTQFPVVEDTTSQPSLTLVPPDDDYFDEYLDDASGLDAELGDEPLSREQEVEQLIADLEGAPVPEQQSLIEIRDNELAALREELANIRGEIYEPVVDDAATDEIPVEDLVADDVDAVEEPTTTAPPLTRSEPSFFDRILGALASWWVWIAGVIIIVGGLLFWFMRRGDDDEEEAESAWQPLDADEASIDALSATGTMQAPTMNESIVVVEQESGIRNLDETVDAPAPDFSAEPTQIMAPDLTPEPTPEPVHEATQVIEDIEDTGRMESIEDTFSSETAINLDQTDPIAEADFHMAYGLYDQAADLVNGALAAEPDRQDLLSKLCEIYFVWGNRGDFVDAAQRLKTAVGGAESAEWDKIVIMGQQIAADDEMFAGAGVHAATKAVDLSFEAEMQETGELDMELVAESGSAADVFDLGAEEPEADTESDTSAEEFDLVAAEASADTSSNDLGVTAEMPTMESTLESPTVEQQFDVISGTGELPSIDETLGAAIETSGQSSDETAEIELDDLGLDLPGLDGLDDMDATEVASLDDLDATASQAELEDEITGVNEVLPEPDATQVASDIATDVGIDSNLLDATGVTQVLSDDFTVDTMSDIGQLADDQATMLAPLDDDTGTDLGDDEKTMLAGLDDDDDEDDFDFAKTEALPVDVFSSTLDSDETGEMPGIASEDIDLDLDDLTAALQVSEVGDTIQQMRDDATIEQPRPDLSDMAEEDDISPTMNLDSAELSADLNDARTMTEVGTKLDLARAYVDMGDPAGARSILEEVVSEGDDGQRQQAQQLLESLPS
jgi:pilus assembly protein FimV